jgi:hypothetical protein
MSRIKNIEVEARNNGTYGAFAIGEGIYQKGLTKREYFAGLAMQGMAMSDLKFEDMAHDAVKMADALLAELRKQEYKSKKQEK